jgi:hypothetical protein
MRPLPSLVIDGAEVLNGRRLLQYVLNGLGPVNASAMPTSCMCSVLFRDIGSPSLVSPAVDGAPWYSASIPTSGEFLGGIVTDIEGLDEAPLSRSFDQRGGDGANLGLERLAARTLTFKAHLIASTTGGLDYGFRWLAERLAAGLDGCATRTLTLRTACPPDNGSNDSLGRYTLYRAALSGPLSGVERASPNTPPTAGDVEWSMVVGDPWLYSDPAALIASTALDPQPAGNVSLEDWLGFTAQPTRHVAVIPAPPVGQTAPVVTIVAGTARDVTDVFVYPDWSSYPSPSDYPSPGDFPAQGSGAPLLPMDGSYMSGIQISRVPRGQTLQLDCARRQATLTTTDGKTQDGAYLLATPKGAAFDWPAVDRTAAGRVIIESGGYASDDGTALVTVQTRNRRR